MSVAERGFDSGLEATLDDAFVVPVFFVELEFDTDPLYLHTDLGSLTTLGHTWLGTGGLGSISPIEETEEFRAAGLKLRLDITDESSGSIFQELTQQDFYQRPVRVYFSTRDITSGALSGTPTELFRGKADVPELRDGSETYVELLVESEWLDGKRRSNRRFSDAQLQADYSGDTGFKFLADLVNRKIVWGRDRTVSVGTGVAGRRAGRGGGGRGGRFNW